MATFSGARLQRKAARTAVSAAAALSFRRCYGIQFTTPGAGRSAVPLIKEAIANGEIFRANAFEYACASNDIEHRTTKARHPWTDGQVERMSRTIKDAAVKRFYCESHDQLRTHLADFVAAYNFARRLKTLKGLTPYEFICKAWTSQPERFTVNPIHQMPGLNNWLERQCVKSRGKMVSAGDIIECFSSCGRNADLYKDIPDVETYSG